MDGNGKRNEQTEINHLTFNNEIILDTFIKIKSSVSIGAGLSRRMKLFLVYLLIVFCIGKMDI